MNIFPAIILRDKFSRRFAAPVRQALPTRIVAKPYREGVNKPLMIPCDNGVTYRMSVLAKLLKYSLWGFSEKLKIQGWRHPEALSPPTPRGYTLAGANSNASKLAVASEGNAAWRALGAKPRTHNLKKIVHGDLERKYLNGEGK